MPSREETDHFFGSPYEQGSQHPDARDPLGPWEPDAEQAPPPEEPHLRTITRIAGGAAHKVECSCGWSTKRRSWQRAAISHQIHIEDLA